MALHPQKILLCIIGVFLCAFFAKALFLGKTVYGDGIYYYSWMRSVVVDHDISFQNEYQTLGGTQPTTSTNLTGNVYPIGPALFWSPFFLFIYNLLHGDGYSLLYQLFIGLVSCLYTISGLVILYRLLCKFFSEEIAILTIIGIAFGTNLFFYGSLDTVNSHSISFFISSVLLTLVVERHSLSIIGFFVGLLALMRTQDAVFAILAIPLLINKNLIVTITSTALFIFSFILSFFPQLIAWQLLYGSFTRSPYLDTYHYFDFIHPHFLEVLFSSNNGLFLWTPLILICIVGWIYNSQISKIFRFLFLILFIVQWFLIASWSFWWQGASYSGRMFISLLPFFSLGLAAVLSRQYFITRISIVSLFSIINSVAIIFYLLHH